MKNVQKTEKELIEELTELRKRVVELEESRQQQSEQEELFHIFRINSPISLFIIQDGKFQFVNDVFRGVTTSGSPGELIDTDPMRLVLPEDREMVRESARKMLRGERFSPYRYRILSQVGEIRWMLEGVTSIQYRGRRAVLGHAMDITERVRAEEKLQKLYEQERTLRQELEAEVQRRIEFTRALVHELKTPLTPVISSSELLMAELHEEPWLSIARNIHRGALNLSKRIDELLDLAKVEIGMLKVDSKILDPLPLLRGIADDMNIVMSGSGQSLNVDLPSSLPLVWADEERLRQIVLNVMINASKFTHEGGKIRLKATERGSFLIVEVQDNGPGIPEEAHQRLFQPYYRQTSDREHLSGLGLGLALSKNLVELQGGRIWVQSRVGKGSTFGFSVPLATASQREEALRQEASDEGSSY